MKAKNRTKRTHRLTRLAALSVVVVFFAFATGRRSVTEAQDDIENLGPGTGIDYTFTNPTAVNIPVSGAASPYPSIINVSNMPTQLAKVTVRLNSLSHTFPSDIDMMLVGPQGQTAVIMSDVGGGTVLNQVTLTLDDNAALPLPTTAITAGTYKPTNAGGTVLDPFPAPAPAPTLNAALSVFQGTNPNGEWKLFIVDDVAIDSGTVSYTHLTLPTILRV